MKKEYELIHTCKPDANGLAVCSCCQYREVKSTPKQQPIKKCKVCNADIIYGCHTTPKQQPISGLREEIEETLNNILTAGQNRIEGYRDLYLSKDVDKLLALFKKSMLKKMKELKGIGTATSPYGFGYDAATKDFTKIIKGL